jgi:FADH2 O2-dependent halogenase
MRDTDVAVIGSGFAGSLIALILAKLGLRVVVLDKARHPRFAIGESSTPAADFVLASLCERYGLDGLRPLCKYGSWQRELPGIACGLKRGFSYFHHRPGERFRQDEAHSTELLVAASASDESGDTHWYRADVDQYFARQAVAAGAELWEAASIEAIDLDGGWTLRGTHQGREFSLRAGFLIDGSGPGGVLPRRLGLPDLTHTLRTRSRTVFGHFLNLRHWSDVLREAGQSTADHPFSCDDAALHHIFDGGWMYVLRFNNGVTSAGFVMDERRHGAADGRDPDGEWRTWMDGYPSVQDQFAGAELAPPFTRMAAMPRLQRRWGACAGPNWALLPHTAGFIDPFFSTGIAQSLCGVERLAAAFEFRGERERFAAALRDYDAAVQSELVLADKIVAACFDTFGRDPRLFASVAALYFAAATTFEHLRAAGDTPEFLLAGDARWLRLVDDLRSQLPAGSDAGEADLTAFETAVARGIGPYNRGGLCNPSCRNMYQFTAAPEKRSTNRGPCNAAGLSGSDRGAPMSP